MRAKPPPAQTGGDLQLTALAAPAKGRGGKAFGGHDVFAGIDAGACKILQPDGDRRAIAPLAPEPGAHIKAAVIIGVKPGDLRAIGLDAIVAERGAEPGRGLKGQIVAALATKPGIGRGKLPVGQHFGAWHVDQTGRAVEIEARGGQRFEARGLRFGRRQRGLAPCRGAGRADQKGSPQKHRTQSRRDQAKGSECDVHGTCLPVLLPVAPGGVFGVVRSYRTGADQCFAQPRPAAGAALWPHYTIWRRAGRQELWRRASGMR